MSGGVRRAADSRLAGVAVSLSGAGLQCTGDKGVLQAFEDNVIYAFAVNNYWQSTRRSRAGAWVQFSLHSCTADTLVIYVI